MVFGGRPETFAGLPGLGERLTKGQTTAEIVASMNMVAEGVKSSAVMMELAGQRVLEMPISAEVDALMAMANLAPVLGPPDRQNVCPIPKYSAPPEFPTAAVRLTRMSLSSITL